MRKRPLLIAACVFLMGLIFKRFWSLEILLLFGVVLSVEIIYGIRRKRYKNMVKRSVLLLFIFLFGMLYMGSEESKRSLYLSKLNDGDIVTIRGEIIKKEHMEQGVRMQLSNCYLDQKQGTVPCNDVLVYASTADYQVGEIHKITGKFQSFARARNEGNFDARSYYQSQKIDFIVSLEEGSLIRAPQNHISRFLEHFKKAMRKVYKTELDEKSAGFYISMLLGDRDLLDEELKEIFSKTGISHILAISGLHMSLIGQKLYLLLRKNGIGFAGAGIWAGVVLCGYFILTGMGISAFRATCMLLVYFLAQVIGRSYDMLNAFGFACFMLLTDNPFLIENTSFWLSFSAILGIGFVSKVFMTKSKYLGGLWTSFGIILATLPVTALCFYEIPAYGPIVNAIVLPMLTPIFLLAVIGGVVGLFFPAFAGIILLPCRWALLLCEMLCQWVTKLPGAVLITGAPSKLVVFCYYVLLLVGVFVLGQIKKRVQGQGNWKQGAWLAFAKLCVGICCISILLIPKETFNEIVFLDVGQGDAVYISTEDGTHMFLDGGSSDESQVGEYRILPFLKSRQIRAIDFWFVSHTDEDHISGLLEVLENRYVVRHLVLAEAAPRDEAFDRLVTTAESQGTKILFMKEEESIQARNWSVECLYPGETILEDKNEASLVLLLQIEGAKAVCSGDISSKVERDLLQEKPLSDVFLFKAAHHGSRFSNSEAFLSHLNPEMVVVSCGENNRYGHPHEEAIERFQNQNSIVWQTKEKGQITIRIEKKKTLVIHTTSLIQ